MAGKTHGEKIDELIRVTATLEARLDNAFDRLERFDSEQRRHAESFQELRRTVAVIEERLNELKRTVEEGGRRRWSLVPVLINCLFGLIGGVIAILAKWLLDYFSKP